jgi:hypothetical protein
MTRKSRMQPGFPRGGRARKIWDPSKMSITSKPTVHFDLAFALFKLVGIVLAIAAIIGAIVFTLSRIHS